MWDLSVNDWLGQEKSLAVFVQHHLAWMLPLGNVFMGTQGICSLYFCME